MGQVFLQIIHFPLSVPHFTNAQAGTGPTEFCSSEGESHSIPRVKNIRQERSPKTVTIMK